jgi:hypothetical protein
MGALRIAAITQLTLLAASSPAAAAPGFLGRGHDPGVAVDAAGTAHVAWLAPAPNFTGTLEYCQVPRGKRTCTVRTRIPLDDDGFGKVQVMLPRPGVVQIVAPLLEPTLLFTSLDNGATFVGRNLGDLPAIETAFYGPGGGISIMSGSGPASYGRFAPDGTGPGELPVEFAQATESLDTTLSPFRGGLIAFFSGLGARSAIWNGLGDPNLPQSWVQGPTLGKDRTDPTAVPAGSGALVAYVQRRGIKRTGIYVRRVRSNGKLGKAKRVTRSDPTDLQLVRGPKGNFAIVYPSGTHDRALIVRSRKGGRWTKPRRLFGGNEPTDLHAVLGRRGGWMVWDGDAGNAGRNPIRISGLPGAPRR